MVFAGGVFAEAALVFCGEFDELFALFGAAVGEFFLAGFALDKEQVAGVVGAIGVVVAGLAALVAFGDDFRCDAFADAFVEDEVFAVEFAGEIFFGDFFGVFDDAAVELVDIFIAEVFEVSGGFFAANAAGAVEEDFLIFFVFDEFLDELEFFAEGVSVGADGVFEVADFAFVMVAHVDDDCALFDRLVELLGV